MTPDLKHPDQSILLFVDLSGGKHRLGGSALATVFNQVGNESPDLEDASLLRSAFQVVQSLLDHRYIASGHDCSDGGLVPFY